MYRSLIRSPCQSIQLGRLYFPRNTVTVTAGLSLVARSYSTSNESDDKPVISSSLRNLSKPRKYNKQQSLRRVPRTPSIESASKENSEPSLKTCTTISTCEQYDLAGVVEQFYGQGLRSASVLLPGEMVHVKYPYNAGKSADVLVLANGTVVAWGMTEIEVMDQLVSLLKTCEINSYKVVESEDMDFVEEGLDEEYATEKADKENREEGPQSQPFGSSLSTEGTSTMVGDVMYIRGDNATTRLLNKAAFSSGLARNTKLAALEFSLEKYIEKIKIISQKLATGGKLGMRSDDALKITGQLLLIRGQLNLYSELIETPDLYWSEPQLEALYTLISRKLDVAPRIAILNKKLDYASELVGILKTHTSEQQSTRLEWMIIILIMVEVCFEIVHFLERYWEKQVLEMVINRDEKAEKAE
ncbi:MIOREX complex component 10 [Trichomonascus vanleenenianus]|uniref:Mrx10p n=1 Tax=Trichomonascus vanleenenianus TaxID=2268995 RepID=UPI003ECA5948